MKNIFLLAIALCSSLAFGQAQNTYRDQMRVRALKDGNVPINHVSNSTNGDLANPDGRTVITDYVGEYVDRKITVTDESGSEKRDYAKVGYFTGVDVQDVAGNIGDGFSGSTLPTGFREFAAAYDGQDGALSSYADGVFTIAGTYVGIPRDFEVRLTIVKSIPLSPQVYGRTYYIHRMYERLINFVEPQSFFEDKTGSTAPITVKINDGTWRHYVRLVVKDAGGNVIQTVGETRTSGVAGNNTATITPTAPLQAGTLEVQIVYYNFHKDSNNQWQPNPNSFNRSGAFDTRILRANNAYINPNLRVILR